jgi:hypothetical protein
MGVSGRISDKISLHCSSIVDSTEIVQMSSHIFFNNFGPWFSKPMGTHKETATQRFCNQVGHDQFRPTLFAVLMTFVLCISL